MEKNLLTKHEFEITIRTIVDLMHRAKQDYDYNAVTFLNHRLTDQLYVYNDGASFKEDKHEEINTIHA